MQRTKEIGCGMSRFRQQFIQVEKDKSRENEVEKYAKGLFWILLIAEN